MKKTLLLFLLLFSIGVFETLGGNFKYDGIYYTVLSEDEKTVKTRDGDWNNSQAGNNVSGNLVLTETVYDGDTAYTLVEIGMYAFSKCSELTNITIPNSVTKIGSSAFYKCSELTNITIPNSVTYIEGMVFSGCSSLRSVTLEDGEATISLGYNLDDPYFGGRGLFADCSLETLYIGRNYTIIGVDTSHPSAPSLSRYGFSPFANQAKLTDVTIGNKITSLPSCLLYNCSGLTSVTIPNSVTAIGDSAFEGCSGLTSVTIGNSVSEIGGNAFEGCSGLTSITIPNSVTEIGNTPFRGCISLRDVTIQDGGSTLSVGNSLFGDCPLEKIYIGRNLSYYGYLNAAPFAQISTITTAIIGADVTYLQNYFFYNCSGLTSITIPNSVTEIGERAFLGCSGLSRVDISDLTAWCNIGFANEYANPLNYAKHLYLNNEEITDLTIPINVSSIKKYAFYNCSGLTSVTIPNSVTEIGNSAFKYCNGLTSVTIGNSISGIGGNAFEGCSGLTNLTLGNSVTEIGNTAFGDCRGLTSVMIPNSVTEIGERAFYGCSGLSRVDISDLTAWCNVGFANEYANPLYYAKHLYLNNEEITDLTIPINVYSIKEYAFYNCSGLTSVTIPASVTENGTSAFEGCSELTRVEISDLAAWCNIGFANEYANPLYYAKHLYLNNEEIIDLTIPANISSIREYAFYNCSGLTSVTIPASVTEIGAYAFEDCSFIEIELLSTTPPSFYPLFSDYVAQATLVIPDTTLYSYLATDWDNFLKIEEENGAKAYIGTEDVLTYRFLETSQEAIVVSGNSYADMTYVSIPDQVESDIYGNEAVYKVTIIGNYAFSSCSKITQIKLPSGLVSINRAAFRFCSGLTSINIPNSVTSIGSYAFYYCESLEGTLVIPSSVTSIGDYAFANVTSCFNIVSYTTEAPATAETAFNGWPSSTEVRVLPEAYNSFVNSSPWNKFNISSEDEFVIVINGVKYSVNESSGTSTCIGFVHTINPNLEIPAEIDFEIVKYNITKIESNAFNGVSELESVVIPSSVTSIGDGAFADCNSLRDLTYNSINCELGENVFPGGIYKLTIGNAVQSIPANFLGSGNCLQVIDIPNSVRSIGTGAFYNSTSLKSLYIGTGILDFSPAILYDVQTVNGVSQPIDPYIIPKVFWLGNTPPDGYKTLPALIHYVANSRYEFDTDIDFKVYQYLSSKYEVDGLVYVPLQPSERTTDVVDCSYDTRNEALNVPATVENMGIVLSVSDIADYAFYDNDYIYRLSTNNAGSLGHYACYDNTNLESASLNHKGNIGDFAFYNNARLNRLVLANTGSLGKSAFQNCVALPEVEIPNSITALGSNCFENCSSMTGISIGKGVEKLPYRVLANCSALPEITIPENVMDIDDYVFAGDSSLTRVIFEDSDDDVPTMLGSNGWQPLFQDCPLDYVYIGCNILYNSTPEKGYSPFYHNVTLREVEITDRETQVYENEFYLCIGLKIIRIGNGVTTIGKWAFSGCSSLEYYSAGYKVEEIHEEAFSDCVGITEYYSYSSIPPVCGTQALDDISKWVCKLFVPSTAVSLYQQAPQWKDFFFVEGIEIPATDITMSDETLLLHPGDTYTLHAAWIPVNATVTNVRWESTDLRVATVDDNGLVTAISPGIAIITVTSTEYPDAVGFCEVRVLGDNEVWYDFVLNVSSLDIMLGESFTLEVLPAYTNAVIPEYLRWTSSDESVATIDNGVITSHSAGMAVIEVTGIDKDGSQLMNPDKTVPTAQCVVNIFKNTADVGYTEAVSPVNDIFTPAGLLVKRNASKEDIEALSPGIYIIGGKKVIVR